jgi:hypothetical protein
MVKSFQSATERFHQPRVQSAIGTDPMMEGDHQRDFAVPLRAARLPQVARRLLDRRLDAVQAIEGAKVVEGRGDRQLVLVSPDKDAIERAQRWTRCAT